MRKTRPDSLEQLPRKAKVVRYLLRFGPPGFILAGLAFVLGTSFVTNATPGEVSLDDMSAITDSDALVSNLDCKPGENILVMSDLVDTSGGAFVTPEAALADYIPDAFSDVDPGAFVQLGGAADLSVFGLEGPADVAYVIVVKSPEGWAATESMACADWAAEHELPLRPSAPLIQGGE